MTSPICEDFPQLVGNQVPHNLWELPGDDLHGVKAVELARRVGVKLFPWQADSLTAMLKTDPLGGWVHSDCVLLVPRQNGKSEVLLIRCLYGLFVLGESIVFSAQRWKTAKVIALRLISLIKSRPSLRRRLAKEPTVSQGEANIVLSSGAEIKLSMRSNDAGRGFTKIDLVLYDEAYNLTEGIMAALNPTQMAADRPQTVYASSAVDEEEHPHGEVLSGLRRAGLAHSVGMYLAEWCAPENMPRDDPVTWRYVNPSYGVIQTDAKMRKMLTPLATTRGRRAFDVEYLGRGHWFRDEADAVDVVIDAVEWGDLANRAPLLSGCAALAIELSSDRQTWAIAAAQYTKSGMKHVELGYFGPGSHGDVVARIVQIVAAWNPLAVVIDRKSKATVLLPLLANVGIEPELTTTSQMVDACGGLVDDIGDALVTHSGQPALTDSVESATKRVLPGGDWVFDRVTNASAPPVVAAALARWGLISFSSRLVGPGPLPAAPSSAAIEIESHDASELDLFATAF